MAAGLDELLEFLLAEIALCGTQGAGSEDFKRFVQSYFESQDSSGKVARSLVEKAWDWTTKHPDIRITKNGQICHYSLSDFESAEKETLDGSALTKGNEVAVLPHSKHKSFSLSEQLLSLRQGLRERLSKEQGHNATHQGTMDNSSLRLAGLLQPDNPEGLDEADATTPWRVDVPIIADEVVGAEFDESSTEGSAPRLYASQNRIWQALTGHEIDLKKVPSMEFILLSIIAAHGETGVTQPDLTRLSNQDKRSVPKRTDELARKGYIFKNPVQSGKIRTSMCVHSKFVSKSHYLTSANVDDVFQDRQFVPTGFAYLLYDKLKDAGTVPTREIRARLAVPLRTWNKRAVQGALIRLDQSGMITRFRVRKNKSEDAWVICIRVLREPRVEDIENLGFRRQTAVEDVPEELLQDDADGDTLMRDLEVDMLDDDHEGEKNEAHDEQRIPPQWTPDQLLANFLFDVTSLGQESGTDGIYMRNRIIGPFWRRPLESYLTRVTDDWMKTQPLHLRHLGIIRDTRTTEEKRFIHYVYRTYGNFRKAVDAGEVSWEGVTSSSVGAGGKKQTDGKGNGSKETLDKWGFRQLESKDFLRGNGAASVSEVRDAISADRKHGPRWDTAIVTDIGHSKADLSTGKSRMKGRKSLKVVQVDEGGNCDDTLSTINSSESSKRNRTITSHLTPDQRIALGLKLTGRLSKSAARQVLEHRRQTGDPESVPDSIVEEPVIRQPKVAPLMTKQERIAANLPPRGRLGIDLENKLREERGLTLLVEKPRKRSSKKEAPIMTKEQRIKYGLKPHGRLHQDFVEALRRERDNDVPLEESPTLKAYLAKVNGQEMDAEVEDSMEFPDPHDDKPQGPLVSETSQAGTPAPATMEDPNEADEDDPVVPPSRKRKAVEATPSPVAPKQRRTETISATVNETVTAPVPQVSFEPDAENLVASIEAEGSFHGKNPIDSTSTTQEVAKESSVKFAQVSKLVKSARKSKMARVVDLGDDESPRNAPGLYVYPSAKRKIGQGRPRSAFIAIFRSSQLHGLHWFKNDGAITADSAFTTALALLASAEPRDNVSAVVEQDSTHSAEIMNSEFARSQPKDRDHQHAAQLTMAHTKSSTSETGDTHVDLLLVDLVRPGALDAIGLPHSHEQVNEAQSQFSAEQEVQIMESEPEPQTEPEPQLDHAPRTDPYKAAGRGEATTDSPKLSPRPIAGFNFGSSTMTTGHSPYRSPYAQSPQPESAPPVQTDELLTVDEHADTVDGSVPAAEDPANLRKGIVAAVALAQGKSSFRSRVGGRPQGLSGSHVKFRQAIILEIIARCDGIYPLHGEIWRPFSALWDEQHGHKKIRKPINSTVFETLREMIDNPAFELKRMTFLAKANNAKGSKQKMMVARKDIPPNDPRVLQLAHDMANNAVEKSNQFYPEQVRDLFDFETLYTPQQIAPKDESITFDQLFPNLEESIKQSKIKRRQEKAALKKSEKAAAKLQNERVEQAVRKKRRGNSNASKEARDAPREKRARLASLNDKNKRYRRAVPQLASIIEADMTEGTIRSPSPIPSDSSDDIPLMTLRRNVSQRTTEQDAMGSSADEPEQSEDHVQVTSKQLRLDGTFFTDPRIEFHPSTGTFGTHFCLDGLHSLRKRSKLRPRHSKKRVRIDETATQRPRKKARITSSHRQKQNLDSEFIRTSTEDSDDTSSEEEAENVPGKKKGKKQKATTDKRLSSKNVPMPTLLERLVGLTGDPTAPIYMDPKLLSKSSRSRNWSERKRAQRNRQLRERQYQEVSDSADNFKRLCCALALAASMSGTTNTIAWNIVERIYAHDKLFDLVRTKRLWRWMRSNMAAEMAELTSNFQDVFLDAYEECRIPEMDDPDNYDWAGVVRWVIRVCPQPDLSLTTYYMALSRFAVDEIHYNVLDRPNWYGKRLADTLRTHTQLQYSFAAPLHDSRTSSRPLKDKILKARSWTRSNVATPQDVYNANKAHDKLRLLGEDVLTRVVGDFVQNEQLKMRKLKRQLPGRNYTFTKRFAMAYRRPFELSDFMTAAKLKKDLDDVFSHEDPGKRFRNISQSEEDGSIMAIMSLVSDGMVTLVPQLPKVDNEFGAPLPRLSKWGFCEGDYIHRAIDRNRNFWDVQIVPTESYEFGNPLEPTPGGTDGQTNTEWVGLPEPPLPGKDEDDALLPIWSSIDGQHLNWPWWYRILNLVLQPLYLQPGITAIDIHAHCTEHATEIFEVQLALDWLLRVGAVNKVGKDGYQATPCFWAAFGDKLHDTEDDWFGEHVKRKTKMTTKQQWREEYNLRFSNLQNRAGHTEDVNDTTTGETGPANDGNGVLSQKILSDSRAQYRIVQQGLPEPTPNLEGTEGQDSHPDVPPAAESAVQETPQSVVAEHDIEDAEMVDAVGDVDMDALGEEDDAIGEMEEDMG